MKIFFMIILILIGMISCKHENTSSLSFAIPEFAEVISVEPLHLKINKNMKNCRGIAVTENYLVLCGLADNNTVHVFDKSNGVFIKSLASLGRKINEVLSTFVLIHADRTDLYLLSQGAGSSKVFIYNLHDSICTKPDSILFIKEIAAPHDLIRLNRIGYITSQRESIYILNGDGKIIETSRIFPDFEQTRDTAEISNFLQNPYGNNLFVSPDGKKMIRRSAPMFLSMVEIFGLTDTLEKIKELRFVAPAFDILQEYNIGGKRSKILQPSKSQGIWGIADAAVDDRYIYILFNPNKLSNDQAYYRANEIWCFDWKGVPVRKYLIKNQGIKRIALDVYQNRMYLVRHESGQEESYGYFQLKK